MRYLLALLLFVSQAFADEAAVKALAPTLWLKSYKGLTATALKGVSAWANQGSVAAGFVQATAGNQPLVSRADNRENRFKSSEAFDAIGGAPWNVVRIAPTANAVVAPDGLTTADDVVTNTTGANTYYEYQALSVLSAATYRASVYAKKRNYDYLYISVSDATTTKSAWFNVNTCAVGTVEAGLSLASSVATIGSGWCRLTITFTAGATSTSGYILFGLTNADNVSAFNPTSGFGTTLWGAQASSSLADSTYQVTTTYPEYRGVCNTAGNHCLPVVRFDGVDDGMSSTATLDDIFNAGAKTAYLVFRPNVLALAAEQNILSGYNGYWYATLNLGASTFSHHNYDTGHDNLPDAITVNAVHVVKLLHDGVNISMSIDGAANTSTASGNTGSMTGVLGLGCYSNGASWVKNLNGSILEVLAFDSVLSAANQAVVEAYLSGVMSASADPWKRVSVLP